MLSVVKHAVYAIFFFQKQRISAWCMQHSSAAAVQNFVSFTAFKPFLSQQSRDELSEYSTKFMESYSVMNMSYQSAILKK